MTKIRSLENRLLTKGLGDDGSRRFTIYLATLVWPISMPSLSNSPWIRGAPHSGLAMLISRWTTETDVTNMRVVHKTGFLKRRTFEMSLDKVENVDVNQSILGRL